MIASLLILAIVAVVALGWYLYRQLSADRLAVFNERRRLESLLVSRGEFVDGNRHLAVALAVTDTAFFYENGDMQASLDLDHIREIEYDTELATGTAVEHGRVLRLRSDSQTFEFILPPDFVARWHATLPPRQQQVPPAAAGGLTPQGAGAV